MGKQIHRSVLMNWVGLAMRIAIAVSLLPYIVALLGVDSYGEYVYLAAIFGYSSVLELGLRAAILRYTGNLRGRGEGALLNRILGTAFSYYAVAAALVCAAGALLYLAPPAWLLPVGASERFPLYAGLFAVAAASSFFRIGWGSVLRATERYDLLNLVDVLGVLFRAVIVVLLLQRGYGVISVIIGDIFDALFSALGSRFAVRRVDPSIRLDFHQLKREELREVLGYSGWAFVNSLAFQLRFRGPSVIVGASLSTGAAGFFGVAARLQSYVMQLGTALNSPFRARATLLSGDPDPDPVKQILYRGTRYLTFLASTMCGLLFLYAHPLLVTWMGPEFDPSADVLQILLLGLGCEISALMLGGALYATGNLRIYALSNLVEATLIIALSYSLAQRFGLLGAAAGVAAPLILNKVIAQPALLLKILGVPFIQWLTTALARPLITLVVGMSCVWVIRELWMPTSLPAVVLHLVAGGCLQLGIAWFILLDREERSVALRTVRLRSAGGSP